MILSNKWPKRDLFREMLVNDWVKAIEHAEMFRKRSDDKRSKRKLRQVYGFQVLVGDYDVWKPKPKIKKEADSV